MDRLSKSALIFNEQILDIKDVKYRPKAVCELNPALISSIRLVNEISAGSSSAKQLMFASLLKLWPHLICV